MIEPYVIVGPEGIVHVGLYADEKECCRIYLGCLLWQRLTGTKNSAIIVLKLT